MSPVQVILPGANFSKVDLSRADFSGANLSGANFSNADFSGANFKDAKMYDAQGLTEQLITHFKRLGAIFDRPPDEQALSPAC